MWISFKDSQVEVDLDRLEEELSDSSIVETTSSDDELTDKFPLDDIIKQLEETESLHSQADLLHYLHCTV